MSRRLYSNDADSLSKGSYDTHSESLMSPAEDNSFMMPVNNKNKPKRNRSAFIIFSSEMRSVLKVEGKEKVNSNEMMVKLADAWKNLKEEERKRYQDMAEKEKVKYLLELNEFYQTHPFDLIQNKTKRNHVKKPCSAYGLFLKETKKTVKAEHPELKMADVLKIVAERWKNLEEKERMKYQNQAQLEKEATKAKLDEQTAANNGDKTDLTFLPQKRLQSQKRVKKALLRENLKMKSGSPDLYKIEETETLDSSPFEDAVFAPVAENQAAEPMINANFFTGFNNDDLFSSLPALTFNFNRLPSIEPIFQNTQSKFEPTKQISTAPLTMPPMEIAELKPKKSNDFLMDLLNFHSIQDNFDGRYSVKDSMVKKVSSTCGTSMNRAAKSSRQALNDALVGALNFDAPTDFGLNFFNFDATFSEINF